MEWLDVLLLKWGPGRMKYAVGSQSSSWKWIWRVTCIWVDQGTVRCVPAFDPGTDTYWFFGSPSYQHCACLTSLRMNRNLLASRVQKSWDIGIRKELYSQGEMHSQNVQTELLQVCKVYVQILQSTSHGQDKPRCSLSFHLFKSFVTL